MSEEIDMTPVDRTGWPAGPWDGEPDRVDFRSHGLPCFILRTSMGHLCGYVGVPNGHPTYGVNYNEIDVLVHGGLSYGASCDPPICHVPEPGESDDIFWHGFDAAHCFDFYPSMHRYQPEMISRVAYRTVEYMRGQCESLAQQLAAMVEKV